MQPVSLLLLSGKNKTVYNGRNKKRYEEYRFSIPYYIGCSLSD